MIGDALTGPHFGPAGNSERFYDEGWSRTVDTFMWQKPLGLTAFEYPFGRGVRMGEGAACEIGEAARAAGVLISAHAPYYINLANPDPETRQRSLSHIMRSARLLHLMGGTRLVVHVGAPQTLDRAEAYGYCAQGLRQARALLVDEGMDAIQLCLETMGRPSVIGTLDEILQLVLLDDTFLPCIDFAHLHAAGNGSMRTAEDFAVVLDRTEEALGMERAKHMHAHFSHIEYGPKGETRHRIFADEGFGPEFALLAPLLAQRDYRLTIICESRGTMADDAAQMLKMYQAARQQVS